ncbi:SH3-domain-containing protein [Glarea lozoyensis ATCC 20868]|uniref:SH3-domain-containing protein n=1 Tax=Glarea lozoyensis (strain ATCC 20868 / MF5171) TaxID=1116229 RepID=S3DC05_GLAL2|nr:SH3-domain-containing protein [Glarea lozoyensis ATCC 20868]EPE29521.1 SH3-domain-containing protein [Glarea lozoyensis ATCC 20868]
MASRLSIEPQARPDQPRPEPGQILLVIHDFAARSSDELSLVKGDRVELIERDDDFGDGWYLGRHLINGNSGLFPEVYTRIAPRGPPSYPPTSVLAKAAAAASEPPKQAPIISPATAVADSPASVYNETRMSAPPPSSTTALDNKDKTQQASRHVSASEVLSSSNPSTPLTPASFATLLPEKDLPIPPTIITTSAPAPIQPKSVTAAAKSHAHGQDSPVMNETLSVIDEHITDMNSPHHSAVLSERRGTNDSGSEYSSHIDHRLSYINGEETDEEEEMSHTEEEVARWTPDQVAEYLFTVGVEAKHCEVFRDQEITGDVILGMDQTSVFLKEFELGSVGRRLKTWQKIKGLQDEVSGSSSTRRNTGTYGSETGSESGRRTRSINSSVLPRIPSVMEDSPGNRQSARLSLSRAPQAGGLQNDTFVAAGAKTDEPYRRPGEKRPSAASIRDMQHSRQNSTTDFNTPLIGTVANSPKLSLPENQTHKKQASFDKNWTMGSATSPSLASTRPLSSSGVKGAARSTTGPLSPGMLHSTNLEVLDRGYFSGGEADGRQRNVLRKRGSTQGGAHSRNSSYTDEQRLRSATANSRHSRYGSVDSTRDSVLPSASQKYYGLSVNGRRRTPSESSVNAPPRPPPPPKDVPSPTVTKLEDNTFDGAMGPKSPDVQPSQSRGPADWLMPSKSSSSRSFGLRAISDAVTGHEKSRLNTPTEAIPSPSKESPLVSPSRTGSSTPSAGPSFDLDSPNAANTSTPSNGRAARKKSKKETSAYTRGLEKKPPKEQMIGADYSGWMKKKSTNLMTTWKPRLFVLKGRRLSYYYSEDDQEEKGLIDISFHRVLPADNDRLTGLHATLTGATNSPTSPAGAQHVTIASAEAAAEPESTLSKSTGDSMFIFKLVPPRAGLSRAVTFTKPTVHYFAVPNIKQGRLWMAALMKATIDRDDSKPITTTYQQKTISLAKARQMRHRPPALMNLDEAVEPPMQTPASDKNGLNIQGIIYDQEMHEGDSGVSGVSRSDVQHPESAKGAFEKRYTNGSNEVPEPLTA